MKLSFHYPILCATLLAVSQSGNLIAQETPATKHPMGRVESVNATLVAEVTDINLTNRHVTLKGPQGNEVTFAVSDAVKRLDEVKVGDLVRLDYHVSMVAELRKPTATEAEHPLVIEEVGGRASNHLAPAGGVARRLKVVTTIEELNLTNQTVTVKGPLGNHLTAQVADPSRLTKVHVGENIVIVYTEAVALSLEKVAKKNE
jgi:hypothetical protein